jgi:hypothetical protein
LKKTARIAAVAVALSAVGLVVAAGPASASVGRLGTGASAPTSHHSKGTDQLDEDGPSYNKPDQPKDADQEDSDITPGGLPVHGSASAVQDAPNKVLPSGADVVPPSSGGGLSGVGEGGLGN